MDYKEAFIMDRIKKAWVNGIFLVVTLIINILGAVGVINGLSQKEISDMYPTLITPSPTTFSIWSLIYLLLLASIIVMIVKKEDEYYQNAIDKITILFRISCVLNILWIILFSYKQIEISVIFILAFVITLSFICLKLKKIQTGKKILLPITFGLYTGWLIIASVVNISSALVKLDWKGFGISDEAWAMAILILAIFIVIMVVKRTKNVIIPLPVAWAYLGIYQALSSPDRIGEKLTLLKITALGGMVVLIGIAAIRLYENKFTILPDKSLEDNV